MLVQVIQGCLQRNVKERLTIQQLLEHPFLKRSSMLDDDDSVVVRRENIRALLDRFKKQLGSLDPEYWTERIFCEWKSLLK